MSACVSVLATETDSVSSLLSVLSVLVLFGIVGRRPRRRSGEGEAAQRSPRRVSGWGFFARRGTRLGPARLLLTFEWNSSELGGPLFLSEWNIYLTALSKATAWR